jgi:hypothetical protein
MKKIFVTLAALGLGAGAALGLGTTATLAQDATTPMTFAAADTDTNGSVSLAEAQVLVPDLTQEAFTAADTSKDGTLDQTEFDAWIATTGVAMGDATRSPNDSDEDTGDENPPKSDVGDPPPAQP